MKKTKTTIEARMLYALVNENWSFMGPAEKKMYEKTIGRLRNFGIEVEIRYYNGCWPKGWQKSWIDFPGSSHRGAEFHVTMPTSNPKLFVSRLKAAYENFQNSGNMMSGSHHYNLQVEKTSPAYQYFKIIKDAYGCSYAWGVPGYSKEIKVEYNGRFYSDDSLHYAVKRRVLRQLGRNNYAGCRSRIITKDIRARFFGEKARLEYKVVVPALLWQDCILQLYLLVKILESHKTILMKSGVLSEGYTLTKYTHERYMKCYKFLVLDELEETFDEVFPKNRKLKNSPLRIDFSKYEELVNN